MIDGMPRPRPPHLHHERSRHGKPVWYVRIGKGPRTRLRAVYGSPDFDDEYRAALTGKKPGRPAKVAGSLAWAERLYRQSSAWLALSPATRRQRENILKRVVKDNGTAALKAVTKTHIVAGRERRAATPAAARNFLETMRGLFAWATAEAIVPLIPINLRPTSALSNYYILWEAEWSKVPPRDPFLLRRLGKGDLWLVLAHWDLTEVERAALATRVHAA